MILSQMSDMRIVHSFMTLEEIWTLAFDDGGSVDQYWPPSHSQVVWLGVYEGIEMIGMVYVQCHTSTTIQMHPYLLKGHKHKVRELGAKFFEWAFSHESIHKVNITIPFIYSKMKNCALKVGYKDEGVSLESYLKGGVLHDQWYMGMTRKDYGSK